jgi:hypothetical protein
MLVSDMFRIGRPAVASTIEILAHLRLNRLAQREQSRHHHHRLVYATLLFHARKETL